jgi:PadR family transcriptional regulator, regulatory protein PadR
MAGEEVRLSGPTLRVLKLMLAGPRDKRSGFEISRDLNIGSGTLYPLLARLEKAGWLKSEWENVNPTEVKRPRRRFYFLTGVGYTKALAALNDLQAPEGGWVWNT